LITMLAASRCISRCLALAFALAWLGRVEVCAAGQARMLVISIDGLRPDYVTEADKHGLKIPTLRKFLAESVYAEGVIGVVPTITYPSHTTMMTGVWPIEHGVFGNQKFNPLAEGKEQITLVSTIQVPTLWEVAHKAGYSVASVGWPVTTGAKFIDWLLPANAAFEGGDPDGAAVPANAATVTYDNPPGLREQLAGALPQGKKLDVNDRRHEWQVEVMRRFKPHFMTAHVGHLDRQQHLHGPFSPAAWKTLEYLDGLVARLIASERAVHPDAYILIVSDHGFLPTDRAMCVNALLARAGLLDVEHNSWKAAAYNTGGTSAIVVRDPADTATINKVKALIDAAARNPEYGIGRVFTQQEVIARGGFPQALLMLEPAPGWRFVAGTKQIVLAVPGTGAHGQMPDQPALRSAFMLTGPGVAAGRNLGVIDMRQIAPTIAKILGLSLPAARLPAIDYAK
jgi:predicted AlkP superfamily pyrophosphatase or phosphodiesterase